MQIAAGRLFASMIVLSLLTGATFAGSKKPPGERFSINPRGSFYPKAPFPGYAPKKPTAIPLADIGVDKGDYIGIMAVGSYEAVNLPGFQMSGTTGVFAEKKRSGFVFVSPADFSNWSEPTGFIPQCMENFPQDFNIVDQRANDLVGIYPYWFNVLRVPASATHLLVNRYGCADGLEINHRYGVLITRPNQNSAVAATSRSSAPALSYEDTHSGLSDTDIQQMFATSRKPGCPRPSVSGETLSIATRPPIPNPQYRGWYKSWAPECSKKFDKGEGACTIRKKGLHTGVDIFAPVGSELKAPAAGILHFRNVDVNGYGKQAWIYFKTLGQDYIVVLSHLERLADDLAWLESQPNSCGVEVTRGQLIAHAGCDGNASKGLPCGLGEDRRGTGARSDHVHVEIVKGKRYGGKERVDPEVDAGWNICIPKDAMAPCSLDEIAMTPR